VNGGEGWSALDAAVLAWGVVAVVGMWVYHRRSKRA
jgi:hypothetical protein